jgi:geranylgeranyl reductase
MGGSSTFLTTAAKSSPRVSRRSATVARVPTNSVISGLSSRSNVAAAFSASCSRAGASRRKAVRVSAVKEGEKLDRRLRVAVIGGGPAGACAAETLAKSGVETYLIERKLDNCKVTTV